MLHKVSSVFKHTECAARINAINLLIQHSKTSKDIVKGECKVFSKYRKRLDNEVVFCIIETVARRASHSIEMMGWIRHRLKCLRLIQPFLLS